MAVDVARVLAIRSRLSKRATFEGAVADLRMWIIEDAGFAASPDAYQLAARCATLLRSRYARTAVAFWKASLELFQVFNLLSA